MGMHVFTQPAHAMEMEEEYTSLQGLAYWPQEDVDRTPVLGNNNTFDERPPIQRINEPPFPYVYLYKNNRDFNGSTENPSPTLEQKILTAAYLGRQRNYRLYLEQQLAGKSQAEILKLLDGTALLHMSQEFKHASERLDEKPRTDLCWVPTKITPMSLSDTLAPFPLETQLLVTEIISKISR
jgi:hypothetical protein